MNYLSHYLARLTKLRVDARTVGGVRLESPYKPALLLAVLEGVEEIPSETTASRLRRS